MDHTTVASEHVPPKLSISSSSRAQIVLPNLQTEFRDLSATSCPQKTVLQTSDGPAVTMPLSARCSPSRYTFSTAPVDIERPKSFDLCETPIAQGHSEHLRRRLASAYFVYFLCGWADGVTGTVLPYFEADYHLTYLTSSLLFAASTAGFFIGTFCVERVLKFCAVFDLASAKPSFFPAWPLVTKVSSALHRSEVKSFSRGTAYSQTQARLISLVLGSIIHSACLMLLGAKAGFVSVLAAYALAAFSRCFLTTILNNYVARAPGKPLGFLMGFWSLGGFAAPFVCQALVAARIPWPRFYFGSLVLSTINISLVIYAWRPTRAEFEAEKQEALVVVKRRSTATSVIATPVSSAMEKHPWDQTTFVSNTDSEPPSNTLRLALRHRYQWAFSSFSFLYYGSEMTIVGFTVTFLLGARNANPASAGYVTSGFWAGMFISRCFWGQFSPLLSFTSQKLIIQVCLLISLVMNIIICVVKISFVNAICTSFIGLVYGPVFPTVLSLASEFLVPEARMVSMALICSFAGLGAALFPFITGLLANVEGLWVFPYFATAQVVGIVIVWFFLPSRKPIAMQVDA